MIKARRIILALALLPAFWPLAAARAQSPAAFTTSGCSVGTSSTQCLAASTWLAHSVTIENVSSGAAVACSWGGTPALNTAGSIMLAAGQAITFGPGTAGVPSAALNCIASAAATPLTIVGY